MARSFLARNDHAPSVSSRDRTAPGSQGTGTSPPVRRTRSTDPSTQRTTARRTHGRHRQRQQDSDQDLLHGRRLGDGAYAGDSGAFVSQFEIPPRCGSPHPTSNTKAARTRSRLKVGGPPGAIEGTAGSIGALGGAQPTTTTAATRTANSFLMTAACSPATATWYPAGKSSRKTQSGANKARPLGRSCSRHRRTASQHRGNPRRRTKTLMGRTPPRVHTHQPVTALRRRGTSSPAHATTPGPARLSGRTPSRCNLHADPSLVGVATIGCRCPPRPRTTTPTRRRRSSVGSRHASRRRRDRRGNA